jgi:hypothetical protein
VSNELAGMGLGLGELGVLPPNRLGGVTGEGKEVAFWKGEVEGMVGRCLWDGLVCPFLSFYVSM